MLNIEGFLDLVYKASAEGKEDEAIDMVFITFDDLAGDFATMNDIQGQVDAKKIPISVMLSFLTQTFKYSHIMPNHIKLYEAVEAECRSRGESEDRIRKLLKGFKDSGTFWKDMKALGAPEWLTGKKP